MDFGISTLARPLRFREATIVGLLLVVGGASYCVLRGLLIYDVPGLRFALIWSTFTLLPWLAAFEGNKYVLHRMGDTRARIAAMSVILLLTLLLSGLVQWLIFLSRGWPLGSAMRLHVVSHIGETIIIALLTVIASYVASSPAREKAHGDGELPVDPARIRWLKSAGNYVEFRTDQRSHMCRMTLRQAQALLNAERFVRISRSVIINRDAIHPESRGSHDRVRLVDGSEHKVGAAYRAEIPRLG